MRKKLKKETPEMEEVFNTIAVDEVYPKTTDIVQFLQLARDKGYITERQYKRHKNDLYDIVMIFQPKSKYGKAKQDEVA